MSVAAERGDRRGERIAFQVLNSIAPLLVRHGVTFDQLSVLARRVLIMHTASIARLRNGRINQSQIAASTGLSRTEVRRYLESSREEPSRPIPRQSKTMFVIDGWLRDKRFSTAPGRPKPLQFSGRGASFSLLVKEYGRDVPPRAMAAELNRQGQIRLRGNFITLRKQQKRMRSRRGSNLPNLLSTIDALISSLDGTEACQLSPTTQLISITAGDALEKDIIRQRVAGILSGATAALTALQKSPIAGPHSAKSRTASRVTVALVVTEGKKASKQLNAR